MKQNKLLLALVFAGAAVLAHDSGAATCESRMLEQFDSLRDRAESMFPKASKIKYVGVAIVKQIPDRNAEYLFDNRRLNTIRLSAEMCELSVQQQDSIIAHELGHVIAVEKGYTSELAADHFGAKILGAAGLYAVLSIFDKTCENDNYSCSRATAWRVAAFNAL